MVAKGAAALEELDGAGLAVGAGDGDADGAAACDGDGDGDGDAGGVALGDEDGAGVALGDGDAACVTADAGVGVELEAGRGVDPVVHPPSAAPASARPATSESGPPSDCRSMAPEPTASDRFASPDHRFAPSEGLWLPQPRAVSPAQSLHRVCSDA